jgi:hypothetical protein
LGEITIAAGKQEESGIIQWFPGESMGTTPSGEEVIPPSSVDAGQEVRITALEDGGGGGGGATTYGVLNRAFPFNFDSTAHDATEIPSGVMRIDTDDFLTAENIYFSIVDADGNRLPFQSWEVGYYTIRVYSSTTSYVKYIGDGSTDDDISYSYDVLLSTNAEGSQDPNFDPSVEEFYIEFIPNEFVGSNATGSSDGQGLYISAGRGGPDGGYGGSVEILGGEGGYGGVQIVAGGASTNTDTGNASIAGGSHQSPGYYIATAERGTGSAGDVSLVGGSTYIGVQGGSASLYGGESHYRGSGEYFTSHETTVSRVIAHGEVDAIVQGGLVEIAPGSATGASTKGGDLLVKLPPGTGAARQGLILVTSLPSTNPNVSGALWYDPTDGNRVKIVP